MGKIRVLLVDANEANCKEAATKLVGDNIEVVGIARSGLECLETLRMLDVDVVLTEITLPGLDGFMLIDKINELVGKKPKCYIMSSLSNEIYVTNALKKDVMYYFFKPVNYDVVKAVILDTYDKKPVLYRMESKKESENKFESAFERKGVTKNGKSVEERIGKIFLTVGIPAHIKGYQYLRYAIKEVMQEPTLINNITKKLYPKVADKFDTSSSKVERAIRHSIEVAWSRGKIDNINNLFGFKIYGVNDRPTNGEFIALVADKLMVDVAA